MDTDPPSKTALKREADRLQAIGLRLTTLKPNELEGLALDESLVFAVREYQRFKSREAKRRQLQFIGRLMRNTEIEAVEDALAQLDSSSAIAKHTHKNIESWRARLLDDSDGLTRFLDEYPSTDRQQLRRLLKRIRTEQDEQNLKQLQRELFRFVKDATEVIN